MNEAWRGGIFRPREREPERESEREREERGCRLIGGKEEVFKVKGVSIRWWAVNVECFVTTFLKGARQRWSGTVG